MSVEQVNRATGKAILALALIALLTVLLGYTVPRGTPEGDEGTGAHIFQLSIVLFAAAMVTYLATADWRKKPRQSALRLLPSAAVVMLAFAALYYLERHWLQAR